MITETQVLTVLKNIIDPDFNKDIVSLGFVKDLSIEAGHVRFKIELTTPACPIKEEFKKQAEYWVGSLKGVKKISVQMTASKPKKRFDPATAKSGVNQIYSFIAISSCKGGVGKSTVSANLALELASRGYSVGLLDADIYGPSVPTLFNLPDVNVKLTAENKIIPIEIKGLKIVSFGFLVGDSPAVMRGPMVSNYINQLIHQVHWGELDYLLIDMPPGTGDIQLTLCQTLSLDGAIIVTTPHALSLSDVGKGILMFEKLNVPVLGVVENMSYFFCEDNQKSYYLFGKDAAQKLSRRFGIEILGKLPISSDFDLLDYFEKSSTDDQFKALFKKTTDNIVRSIGKNSLRNKDTPTIKADKFSIQVSWTDGKTLTADNKDLRYFCNSARNVDERSGVRLIDRNSIPADISATSARTLGNYAIAVDWTDGHKSIFPYSYFEEIARGIKE